MRSVSDILKTTYGDQSAIVVPGSGSFGMEAVARQFSTGQQWLVRRNGWFGYRWRQILEMGQIPAQAQVLKAQKTVTDPLRRSRLHCCKRFCPRPAIRNLPWFCASCGDRVWA